MQSEFLNAAQRAAVLECEAVLAQDAQGKDTPAALIESCTRIALETGAFSELSTHETYTALRKAYAHTGPISVALACEAMRLAQRRVHKWDCDFTHGRERVRDVVQELYVQPLAMLYAACVRGLVQVKRGA